VLNVDQLVLLSNTYCIFKYDRIFSFYV